MTKEKKVPGLYIFIIIAVLLVVINHWIQRQIGPTENKAGNVPVVTLSQPVEEPTRTDSSATVEQPQVSGDVIRKTIVERGSEKIEHIFFIGDKEIARQAITKDGKVTQEGTVPDGPVKFYDSYTGTSGVEYFENGKQNGNAKSYFDNGLLRSESRYANGQLINTREYYGNGHLMFEVDYHDARNDKGTKEVGVGKLYFPNGSLKYEWNLTNTQPKGYKKSYNMDGTLRAETDIDASGKVIKSGS